MSDNIRCRTCDHCTEREELDSGLTLFFCTENPDRKIVVDDEWYQNTKSILCRLKEPAVTLRCCTCDSRIVHLDMVDTKVFPYVRPVGRKMVCRETGTTIDEHIKQKIYAPDCPKATEG